MSKKADPADLAHMRGLTSASHKDLAAEQRLGELNALVAPLQATLEQGVDAPRMPPVFILGPPRGGTTLASQLVASTGLFAIATNFVARFWRAPALGMMIERATGLADTPVTSSYRSRRGMTEGLSEPSEFGYFWSSFFDLGQPTHVLGAAERERFDVAGLRRALAAMEAVAQRPLAFKNNTWFTLNADLIAETFPGCVLVVCEREPFFVAQSIWQQRLDLHGDEKQWWSVRPAEFAAIQKLPPLAQVAAQAVAINRGMATCLAAARGCKIVRADYERLTREPRAVVSEILAHAGFETAKITSALDLIPAALTSTDKVRIDGQLAQELREHVLAFQTKAP